MAEINLNLGLLWNNVIPSVRRTYVKIDNLSQFVWRAKKTFYLNETLKYWFRKIEKHERGNNKTRTKKDGGGWRGLKMMNLKNLKLNYSICTNRFLFFKVKKAFRFVRLSPFPSFPSFQDFYLFVFFPTEPLNSWKILCTLYNPVPKQVRWLHSTWLPNPGWWKWFELLYSRLDVLTGHLLGSNRQIQLL